jgi:hypothetical protein
LVEVGAVGAGVQLGSEQDSPAQFGDLHRARGIPECPVGAAEIRQPDRPSRVVFRGRRDGLLLEMDGSVEVGEHPAVLEAILVGAAEVGQDPRPLGNLCGYGYQRPLEMPDRAIQVGDQPTMAIAHPVGNAEVGQGHGQPVVLG